MRVFEWNEPIDQRTFHRAALPWLVDPFVAPPLVAHIGPASADTVR